jgi:hypothetical protein
LTLARYGTRTAGFALLYLLALFVGHAIDGALWPAAAVGAIWLVAQGDHGPRRFDALTMLVISALVPATDGLLEGVAQAAPQVVPAVLFAWLLDRWLPGYWQGLGDRFFGGPLATLGRLAAAAAVAAAAGAVLQGVTVASGFSPVSAGFAFFRDLSAVLLATLAVRSLKMRYAKREPVGDTDFREMLRHKLEEVYAPPPDDSPAPERRPAGAGTPRRSRRRPGGEGPDGRPHLTIVK